MQLNKLKQYNGLFLSFEGLDGSGKTTQISKTKEWLESKNWNVMVLREPGGTVFGEKLRSAILETQEDIDPLAQAMLFASSRAQLLSKKILPFLSNKNHCVILDRYIDSSIAYQGYAAGLGMETITQLHSYSPLNQMPDLTFYLEINLETSLSRQSSRGEDKDYFEKNDTAFYQKLELGYKECCKVFSERIKVINAIQDIENVFKDIKQDLNDYIV
mgnify:CR=1 FL=1